MVKKLAIWVTRHPKSIALVSVILLLPSALGYAATDVNYDILMYLPKDLPSVRGINALGEGFDMAASSVVIIDGMSAKDVLKTKRKLEALDGVKSVFWVDDIADITIPAQMLPEQLTNIFYSKDFSSTLLLVRHSSSSSSEETLDTIGEMREILGKQSFISGLSASTADTREMSGSSAVFYTAVAVMLTFAALLITQRSLIMPLILLSSMGFAVVFNMGTNFAFGSISFITQATAAVLQLGVTMDYSVFLIDRYEEEKKRHQNNSEAMAAAIEASFRSILASSLTTIFGFLSLCFMSLTIGFDIGLVMAKGVIFGIITVLVLLPSFILVFYKPSDKPPKKSLVPDFSRLNEFTVRHSRGFAIAFLLLFIPAYLAKSNVKVFYNMGETMPQETGSVAAVNKLREDFGFAATHFALVDSDISPRKMTDMLDEIETTQGVSGTLSQASLVGAAIPESMLPESLVSLGKRGGQSLILIFSTLTSGTPEASGQINAIKDILSRYSENALLTGDEVLTNDLVEIADRDFTVTGIISIISIFVLIALSFKSILIPVLLVSCIELAIFINSAVPYFMGTEIPFISPTIIGCVQLGATVDYAILLTNRLKEERKKGTPLREAVTAAASASSKSIFCSALVLFSATVGVYFVCDIVMVQSICAMLARGAVISAGVIIVFLTPLLYLLESYYDKHRIKTFCIGRNDLSIED